jgi:N-acetylmuramoyl-L-alanine amidase
LIIPLLVPFIRFEISVSDLQILPVNKILPVVPGLFENDLAGPGTRVRTPGEPIASTILSYVFIGGMLLSVIRICTQGVNVLKVLASCRKRVYNNVIVFESNHTQQPFSFAGRIIIPTFLFQDEENLEMIMTHEAAHAKKHHHSDLLIYALCQVICWWNPVVYLIRRQLITVHEFEADAAVVSKFDRSLYARLLLSATFNVSMPVLIHSFFQSPIKLRIMRFNENNKKTGLHRYWLALPLVACVTFMFCVSFVPVKMNGPLKKYKIVIDAGHGGMDAGVSKDGSSEKDITLKIARLMAKDAEEAGIEVVMTRTGDELPVPGDKDASLRQRVEIVKSANPDVFVSLHIGASDDNYNGLDAFVSANDNETTTRSKVLATSILQNLQNGPLKVNMQIKQSEKMGIWVLDKSPVPVVLLELGYLTNDNDYKILMSDENLRQIASLIVGAIKNHSGE